MTNHINLMTTRAQVRECSRTRLRQWSRILGATVGLLALHGVLHWWPVHVCSQQRAALESQYEPLRQMKLENKSLEQNISSTLDKSQLELALSKRTPVVTMVGLVGRAVADTQGKVFLDKITYSQTDPNDPTKADTSKVQLEGISKDPVAVGEFADHLKNSVEFANVQVGTVEAFEINKHRMQTFKIDLSF